MEGVKFMYWITGILGILLVIAPFVLGYTLDSPALWSNIILGVIVFVVSAIKGLFPDRTRWEYIIAAIMGILAILAPFALGFNMITSAMWASVVLGVVLAVLAFWGVYDTNHHQTN
jgi:hypothetical protein